MKVFIIEHLITNRNVIPAAYETICAYIDAKEAANHVRRLQRKNEDHNYRVIPTKLFNQIPQ
jgi:hypothetical protein